MPLGFRKIYSHIETLRSLANNLRSAADSEPVKMDGLPEDTILASAGGLTNIAQSLDEIGDDLLNLIPDEPVEADVEDPS